jgi:hypothetical protein
MKIFIPPVLYRSLPFNEVKGNKNVGRKRGE